VGDGIPSAEDLTQLLTEIGGLNPSYNNVCPPNRDTQDLDLDGIISANDYTTLLQMIGGLAIPFVESRPASLELIDPAGGVTTIDAGDTLRVTIGVLSSYTPPPRYSAGFGVIFEIDPVLSTATAEVLGGDGGDTGANPASRYDTSGPIASGGRSSVVIRVKTAGTVYLNARLPECGSGGNGRYCAEILLTPAAIIVAP
jgi:hypothetical protein